MHPIGINTFQTFYVQIIGYYCQIMSKGYYELFSTF